MRLGLFTQKNLFHNPSKSSIFGLSKPYQIILS